MWPTLVGNTEKGNEKSDHDGGLSININNKS